MKLRWRPVVLSASAFAVCGLLFLWSGVIDIRASSGHWRATDWLLHWVMRSSVRTWSLDNIPPDIDTTSALPIAASHFETACADCHGSPERRRSPTALGMLPPPPDLKTVAGEWSDAELFQIVRHGVRYTGMPAWSSDGRDDEVWGMVAFLRSYGQIDAENYRALRGADEPRSTSRFDILLAECDTCHAATRVRANQLIPNLDGQSFAYLRNSLQAFRDQTRSSGIMRHAVRRLDDGDIDALARHYARRTVAPTTWGVEPDLVSRGDVVRKIPACSTCHDRPGANPSFPKLLGLNGEYVKQQIRLFVDRSRSTRYGHLMAEVAKNLSEKDIEELTRYYDQSQRIESKAGQ